MKYLRPALGILLIIASLSGIWYWETYGRETWLMEDVLVAACDIEEGSAVDAGMFKRMSVPGETLISGALAPEDARALTGKIATRDIAANSQVAHGFFSEKYASVPKGKSLFVINGSWIDMMSSTLRAGDSVRIYGSDGDTYLGKYEVAFVKDGGENEVTCGEGVNVSDNLLERVTLSAPPDHIEIIAKLSEYRRILNFLQEEGRGLMIVQDGNIGKSPAPAGKEA